jgi:hypothetical protein
MCKSGKEFFSSFIDILYEATESDSVFESSFIGSVRSFLYAHPREPFDADLSVSLRLPLAPALLIRMKLLIKDG